MSETENLSDLLNKAADWMEKDAETIERQADLIQRQSEVIKRQMAAIKELEEYAKYANQVIEALYDNLDDAYERAENS